MATPRPIPTFAPVERGGDGDDDDADEDAEGSAVGKPAEGDEAPSQKNTSPPICAFADSRSNGVQSM
jgi:hypothetical protein